MNAKIKIDVSKISKSRLFKGAKGTYLDCVLIESKNEFSDFMIIEQVTKEEREAGVKGAIIGNGSYFGQQQQGQPEQQPVNEELGELPF